jgi:flavin-binding protein dodecin
VKAGIEKASESLRNIQGAWVSEEKVEVKDGAIAEFRVTLRITFLVE